MVSATEERTETDQQDHAVAVVYVGEDSPPGGDPETEEITEEILEPPTVQVFAQNLKLAVQAGKVTVSFEIEGPASGVGIGTLGRIAVIGTAEVAIRASQTELPL